MTYYRRRSLEPWEELTAAGVGVLAGLAAYYVGRQWMRRVASDPSDREGPHPPPRGSGGEVAPGPRPDAAGSSAEEPASEEGREPGP